MSLPRSSTTLRIRQDEPLRPYTTFKIGGPARYFASAETPDEIEQALEFQRTRHCALFVLGGGSNIVVSDAGFDGLVLHLASRGVRIVREDADTVTVRVEAGETWDDVVRYAVKRGWWGIENLSHIPGQAGAALVQNIGAYGHEISDVFERAEVMEIASGAVTALGLDDCLMAYRESIFNTARKGQLIILNLRLRLRKQGEPNLTYPDVETYFRKRQVARPNLAEIRQAIIAIRDLKFPFPLEEKGGNAGSFFKNLLLMETEYGALERNVRKNFDEDHVARLRALKKKFPATGRVKIPSAFLIEACGLRGHPVGRAEVNEKQPLILLNQGGATARDVMTLARHIRSTVFRKTGARIALEPELVGFEASELAEYLAFE